MMNKRVSMVMAAALSLTVAAGCASSSTQPAANDGKNAAATPAGPTKISIMASLKIPEVPTDTIQKLVEEKPIQNLRFNGFQMAATMRR